MKIHEGHDEVLYDSYEYHKVFSEGYPDKDDVLDAVYPGHEKTAKVYLAGHSLDAGAVMIRNWEKERLRELGAKVYAPLEDKSINDKATAVQDGLAERIVANDTEGIMQSDTIVIDTHEDGKGTLVELGQLKGMKDVAEMVRFIAEKDEPAQDLLLEILHFTDSIEDKKVYAHNTDIRRANTSPQSGDRREYAPNQYVYGTVLDLTDGYGFYDWEEIEEAIKEGE